MASMAKKACTKTSGVFDLKSIKIFKSIEVFRFLANSFQKLLRSWSLINEKDEKDFQIAFNQFSIGIFNWKESFPKAQMKREAKVSFNVIPAAARVLIFITERMKFFISHRKAVLKEPCQARMSCIFYRAILFAWKRLVERA